MVLAAAAEAGMLAEPAVGRLAGEQQQVVAALAQRVLEAHEHLVEERVLQVGVALAGLQEHADDVRAAGDERRVEPDHRPARPPLSSHDRRPRSAAGMPLQAVSR